jgi:hypothetical protein
MTYTCALCGKEFESTWSDEEDRDEKERLWSDIPENEPDFFAVVCDDCYRIVMRWIQKKS